MDRRHFLKTSLAALLAFFFGGKINALPQKPGMKEALYYRSPDSLAG
ncbi:MAG: twin-arginine translocation signal domain-containing protein [Candidatus Omnitrophota bacterium]